jgi:hypothetical protein
MRKRTKRQIQRQPGITDTTHIETPESLSSRILRITMRIKEKHPELSKYIEEMAVTIPDKKNPEITIAALQNYYDSLHAMLGKYELEHPTRPTL